MPWKVNTVMDEKMKFISLMEDENCPGMAAVCRDLGISRKTGYKWLSRYRSGGVEGLEDHSRAALNHPNAIGQEMVDLVIQARLKHPSWGAKKLLPWLQRNHPGRQDWPCLASISAILDRHQLVRTRRLRRRISPYPNGLTLAAQPNDLWCIDHKGWWLCGNGDKCEPFTVTDDATRFLVRCVLRPGKGIDYVKPVLTAAFMKYGLPAAIRSDNGPPFATRAPLGLSELSVWLMRLGIVHERIEPGKPQQNGRHERMHLSMLVDRRGPVRSTVREEQKRLSLWREEFNHDRPHEALGFHTPASCFSVSPRPMPRRLPEIEYRTGVQVRTVDVIGKIGWKGRDLFLTEALRRQRLGFEAIDNGLWTVWLAQMELGIFDERAHRMTWHNPAGAGGCGNAVLWTADGKQKAVSHHHPTGLGKPGKKPPAFPQFHSHDDDLNT